MKPKSTFLSLFPLFMVIFLDVAGIILVLPVLAPLILKPESGLVSPETSLFWRDFLYGFSLASFPLFMFFSTPILGDLSDKFGRKKLLILCLIGSALSYVIAAIGIMGNSLVIFFVGRIMAGLAAGTQPIATAAIIDASTEQNKTKYLAWVVFVSSLGLVIGPALGGIIADKTLISWFGFETPFFIAGGLSFLNALFLFFSLKETPAAKSEQVIRLTKGFILFLSAFAERKFRLLSILFFCFILAWSLYYQTITWFFMEKYHYSVGKLGIFVAFIGVVFAISTSVVVRLLLKWAKEINVFIFSVFIMGVANIGAAVSQGEAVQWFWSILVASGDVICLTIALAIFSNLVDLDSQGWIMGVTNSLGALTWTIGGFIAGPLGYINLHVPLWTAGILCFVSFFLMLVYKKAHK